MKIIEKIAAKQKSLEDFKIPTIAFLGDSVTQGCFDVYINSQGGIETYFDRRNSYSSYIEKIFQILFPGAPVNIINAGISGSNAEFGWRRLERDVLVFQPDLTVVSFGLNDCSGGLEKLPEYQENLRKIFVELQKNNSEVIFMTENMMNTELSCHIQNERIKLIAENTMKNQNEGILDAYFNGGKEIAEEYGVKVCDVYAKWKRLAQYDVNTTALLSNHINHPTKEMNWLFAYSLVECMMQD